jgi:hypothetical protein
VPLQVWREGKVLDLTAQPGRLGVMPSMQPAAQTIIAGREGDQLVRSATKPPCSGLTHCRGRFSVPIVFSLTTLYDYA